MYVLAGLSTLVLSSYPAQRRYAATASAACLLVIGLPGFFVWFIDHPPGASSRVDLVELMRVAFDMKGWGATSILVLATLVVAVALRVRSGLAPREQYALLLLFTLGFLAILPLPWDLTVRLESALDFVFPVAVLLVGLVWIPEEEPG